MNPSAMNPLGPRLGRAMHMMNWCRLRGLNSRPSVYKTNMEACTY